jgi:hypothetical protein
MKPVVVAASILGADFTRLGTLVVVRRCIR